MLIEDELIFAAEDGVMWDQPAAPCWLILIVDDDLEVHRSTEFVLANQKKDGRKFKLESAFSGQQALARIADPSLPVPHLVLMDVVMDYATDGIDATHQIRRTLGQRNFPYVIVRTGQPGADSSKMQELVEDEEVDQVLLKAKTTGAMLLGAVFDG